MNKILNALWAFALFSITYHEVNAKSIQVNLMPVGIVNGTNAEEGEFPYLVQVLDEYNDFACGGSIISDKWVLTAGHCTLDFTPVSIVYGTNNLYNQTNAPNTTIGVKQFFSHPKYIEVDGIPLYDVGILELSESIKFSDKAKPIKLAEAGAIVPFHVNGTLAGWGVNKTTHVVAQPYLQKINLQLLTDSECRKRIGDYAKADIFNATHDLCSDDHWNGECYGDSGSPFVINGIQYGIVSWSVKPCGSNPGTYSRIPNPEYRQFIKNVTGI